MITMDAMVDFLLMLLSMLKLLEVSLPRKPIPTLPKTTTAQLINQPSPSPLKEVPSTSPKEMNQSSKQLFTTMVLFQLPSKL
jgi:hypothetical protein